MLFIMSVIMALRVGSVMIALPGIFQSFSGVIGDTGSFICSCFGSVSISQSDVSTEP